MFSKTNNEVCRLKSKADIAALFAEGNHLTKMPIKLVCSSGAETLALGFGVSKKNFNSAVDRNRIKRLMREQFKQQRAKADYAVFYGSGFFIYTGKEKPTLAQLEKPMADLICRWYALAEGS